VKTPLYKRPNKAEQSIESYSCRCICGGCGSVTCNCSCPVPSTSPFSGNSDTVRWQASSRLGSEEHHSAFHWIR